MYISAIIQPLGGNHIMPMAQRTEKLRVARDQLVPVLTILDDCEEHLIAAIVSTALDNLDARIELSGRPDGATDIVS